jgi:hypothetical protein
MAVALVMAMALAMDLGEDEVGKYRKKPVVIEAMQFDGSVESALKIFAWAENRDGIEYFVTTNGGPVIEIVTLEGVMRANKNDWIIRGVKGEFYPCKPDVFEMTYEAVKDD